MQSMCTSYYEPVSSYTCTALKQDLQFLTLLRYDIFTSLYALCPPYNCTIFTVCIMLTICIDHRASFTICKH